MSQISREAHLTLEAAFREAVVRRHAYVTVEHLLYALLHDERGLDILRHAGGQIRALKAALERFFAEDLESVPGDESFEALQTLAFHRVLQSAVEALRGGAEGGGRRGGSDRRALPGAGLLRGDAAALPGRLASRRAPVHRPRHLEARGRRRRGARGLAGRLRARQRRARRGARGPAGGVLHEPERAGRPGQARPADRARQASSTASSRSSRGAARTTRSSWARRAWARRRSPRGWPCASARGASPRTCGNAEIFALDIGALLAGTRYRGDFELRFKALIAAIQAAREPDSLHRRDPHDPGRGLRAGRHRRRLEHAEAAARLGRAALHGLDHLPGLPPLRARPRSLAPLPARGRHRADARTRRFASSRAWRPATRSTTRCASARPRCRPPSISRCAT